MDSPTPRRLHGLDALRAGALLLGIVLHALMPFMPGGGWLVVDTQPFATAFPMVAVIHLLRMMLFLLLAGFFGRMVVHRKGVGAFVRDRLLRIGLPLVAFWPVAVLPLGLIAAFWSMAHGRGLPQPPEGAAGGITPGQLWFLWVLLQCCAIVLLVRWAARRLAPRRAAPVADRAAALIASPYGVPLLAVPYLTAVLWQGESYGGLTEPRTLAPEPAGLLAYLSAFVAGWLLHRRTGGLAEVATRRWAHAAVAVVGSTVVVGLADRITFGGFDGRALTSAVAAALAAWAWVYGLLGLCVTHLRTERPAIRYLADASYWMYLLHLPIVLGLGALITHEPWPAPLKTLLVLGMATALLLLSYDAVVRSTWLGLWLNGHRRPRAIFRRRVRS